MPVLLNLLINDFHNNITASCYIFTDSTLSKTLLNTPLLFVKHYKIPFSIILLEEQIIYKIFIFLKISFICIKIRYLLSISSNECLDVSKALLSLTILSLTILASLLIASKSSVNAFVSINPCFLR